MYVSKDNRINKAILKKMAIENDFELSNVYVNPHFKYVETISHNKKDADFCQTEYKGKKYKVMYLSGCFNPFIVCID